MAALHLELPDDIKRRLAARAAESGYPSVEQYAEALLRDGAQEQVVDEDIESLFA